MVNNVYEIKVKKIQENKHTEKISANKCKN